MKPPVTLPRLRVVPSGPGPHMNQAEVAVDLAAAVMGVQAVILQALIKSGVLDLKQWRALFQAAMTTCRRQNGRAHTPSASGR